jgi:mannitol-1-/sugar-/sorbitol-6-/2-deoxyglucose-6-phosphatase
LFFPPPPPPPRGGTDAAAIKWAPREAPLQEPAATIPAVLTAAILDMDGLLCDSEPFWQDVEVEELNKLGVPLTREMCYQTVGLRVEEAMGYWHARYPWDSCTIAQLSDTLTEGVRRRIVSEGSALPGVHHALDLLQARGLRLAIASGSRRVLIEAVLDKLALREHVELVVSAEEVPHGKPHPEVFLVAAERLGIDPLECLVLEDSLNGVIAAKAARMKCIAVPGHAWASDPRFVIADLKLSSLTELTAAHLDALG